MSVNPSSIDAQAEGSAPRKIPGDILQLARTESAHMRRRMVDVLEEKLGVPPALFTARLGLTLHYPVLSMEQMQQMKPAFDLLPFSVAQQKNCVAFRDDAGQLLIRVNSRV